MSSWRLFVGLFGKGPLAPVNISVGSEIGTVKIVGTSGQCFSLKPFRALIGDSIPIRIRQFPDAGRCRNVERSVVPERSFGKHHLVGEDHAFVETSIAIGIFQTDDPMRPLDQLFINFVIGPRGICHVEATLFIEIGGNRAIHERRCRHKFDFKPIREGKSMSIQIDFTRQQVRGGQGENGQANAGCLAGFFE